MAADGLQGRPSVNVKWYAKGGVFTDRSLIGVGEYPGAASNPEIATPQSIMRDTVAGVLQSDRSNQYDVIYRAIYSALTALGPDLFNPDIVLEMDSRVCGRSTPKIRQAGTRASERVVKTKSSLSQWQGGKAYSTISFISSYETPALLSKSVSLKNSLL